MLTSDRSHRAPRRTRRRPAAERLGAVVERLAVLIGAGVSPATAWTYIAEGSDDPVLLAIARRIERGAGVAEAIALSCPGGASRLGGAQASGGRPTSGGYGAPGGTSRLGGAQASDGRRTSGEHPSSAGSGASGGARGPGVTRVPGEAGAPGAGRALGGSPAAGGLGAEERERGRLRSPGQGAAGADAWNVLGAAWFVASEAGAPLARCLGDIADSLRAVGQVERDTASALAGPAATTRLVTVLPLISVASGWLLGLDTGPALLGTPAGIGCLALGVLLMLAGRVWSGALLRRARRVDPAPGLALDLVAVAVGGGGSLPHARRLVAAGMTAFALDAEVDSAAIASVLALAARSGAPPGDLLRSEAGRLRRDAVSGSTERAAALGTWLMLPLGVCVLPAFMLLAVAPVLIGVLVSTGFS